MKVEKDWPNILGGWFVFIVFLWVVFLSGVTIYEPRWMNCFAY